MDIISLKHPDKAVPFCRANDVYLRISRKMDGTRVMAQEYREQLLLRGEARSGVPPPLPPGSLVSPQRGYMLS